MANLRTNNLSGEQGQNAIRGSVVFGSDQIQAGLRIEDNSELELGSETNWTIEFWIWLNGPTHGDYDVVLGKGSGTGNNYEYYVEIMSDNTLDFLTTTAGTAWDFQQQISPVLQHDSWHHIAIVRNGSGSNSLKSYVNGQEYGSFTAQNIHTSSYPFGIGYYAGYHAGSGLYGNAILSNVRIVKGTSVYTAAFTPPFQELTAIPDTVLLCCQDSDNPLKEETGKTITGVGIYEHLNDTELVTNGSGLTTTGWTDAYTSTFTVENGMIKVTRSGGSGYTAYQTITTVDGQQYTVSVNIQYSSGNYADLRVLDGGTPSGSSTMLKFLRSTGAGTDGKKSTTFTAASTSTTLVFTFDDGGDTGYFSQISVKATDRGKFPKVIPPYGVDAGNTFGGPIQQSTEGYMYFPTGRTEERGAGIGIVAGGYSAATNPIDTIESIRIQTMGNSIQFGTLNAARFASGAVSSTSRVIFGGGYQPSNLNSMEFVNPTTQGNGTDAGDLSAARKMPAGLGNSTRGIFAGGREPGAVNTIEFVTIASLGDAVNFGDLTSATFYGKGCASPTRGVIACSAAPTSRSNVINFITIASAGDAQDFGDLTEAFGMTGFGLSDATRGVIGGHYIAPANNHSNVINFVTIATTGDATDFGDMVTGTGHGGDGFSDKTRGVIFGQYTDTPHQTTPLNSDSQGAVNLIQMITIQTTGNAIEFGDLVANSASNGRKYYANGNSNSHGGLS